MFKENWLKILAMKREGGKKKERKEEVLDI
jgi:hypothetical protein